MYSQRPHPLHLLASTIGRWLLSRAIASKGHSAWHLVQPPHAHATHLSLSTWAIPNLTAFLSIGSSAPVGQTSMHFKQRLQYPRRKLSLGVPALATPSVTSAEVTVPVGQTSRHFWHLMQRERNFSPARAPGGRMNLSSRPMRYVQPPKPTTMATCPTSPRNARRVSGNLFRPRSPFLLNTSMYLLESCCTLHQTNSKLATFEFPRQPVLFAHLATFSFPITRRRMRFHTHPQLPRDGQCPTSDWWGLAF